MSCQVAMVSLLRLFRFDIPSIFGVPAIPGPQAPFTLASHLFSTLIVIVIIIITKAGSRVLIYLCSFQPFSPQAANFTTPLQMSYGVRRQWSTPIRPSLSNPISPTSYAPSSFAPPSCDPRPRDAARGASEILPRLYISDLSFAENPASLSSYGITHVLSTLSDNIHIPTVHPPPKRLQIKIEDFPFAELAAHLPTTTAWIRDAIKSSPDARVLVHCGEGISRSVSVVAAFLIATYGWTPVEALQYIKSKRRVADPNFGFVQQLGEYARSLPSRKS
jgi:atypical dual specificity phosphatase